MIFLWASCTKNEPEVVTHIYNATMKVNVYQQVIKLSGDVLNVPVKDVKVDLYKTEYDRQNNQNLIVTSKTDSTGFVQFSGLKEKYYYITAFHPSFGVQLAETSTPDGSVSFVEIIF